MFIVPALGFRKMMMDVAIQGIREPNPRQLQQRPTKDNGARGEAWVRERADDGEHESHIHQLGVSSLDRLHPRQEEMRKGRRCLRSWIQCPNGRIKHSDCSTKPDRHNRGEICMLEKISEDHEEYALNPERSRR
ncbi:hypothetical protein SASPL_152585 [Salvia splendens]|uniref:Uncharacterized protein n=1 Tax=Salvia splendens TaxID=180675 RepID=A0A8X8W3I4_SALSN|nr:hypothetical protein SASPL_152585 [Salvia splendens]